MGKFANLTSDFSILLKAHIERKNIGLFQIYKTFKKTKIDTKREARQQKKAIKDAMTQINDK